LNGDLQGALRRIAEQAERAGKVIKSVHNFVRRREGERANVAPAALLDAIMPLVGLQAQKLGIELIPELGTDLPLVYCDRTMVEQVLLNLARNGMQAIDENHSREMNAELPRRLQFSLTHDAPGARVRFAVTDDGPGIAPAVAAQLFTPFFTTKAEGMGLGLSLCRTVIEQHGGKLEFENAAPRGTIFSFTLPAFYASAPCNPPLTP
jgi:two-component system, LuxR family, sensor histidine kinase DctS